MKLIVGVILILALLELALCAPLIGSDDGRYKETHTSSSWGYGVGADVNLGLVGGFKDGELTLGTKNHVGVNVEGHKENGQKDIDYAVAAAPPPNNLALGSGSPYVMPNNPANGSPYYTQYAPQPSPQYLPQGALQFAPQPFQQYAPQQPQVGSQYTQQWPQFTPQQAPQVAPQYGPQYAYAPQYAPQTAPQYTPQYAYAPQYAPQTAPQYTPQTAPRYAPQTAPQYAPQTAPEYATKTAPQYTLLQRTINEENTK